MEIGVKSPTKIPFARTIQIVSIVIYLKIVELCDKASNLMDEGKYANALEPYQNSLHTRG